LTLDLKSFVPVILQSKFLNMKNLFYLLAVTVFLFSCSKDDDQPNPAPSEPQNTLPEKYRAFKNIFDGNGVGAAADLGMGVILLFNQDGDRYAWFEDGEIKVELDLDDSESIFRDAPLQSVGAAALTRDNRLYIFNEEGERFAYCNFEADEVERGWNDEDLFSWNSSSNPTNEWGPDNTIAFDRVSAMWTLANPGEGCFDAFVEYRTMNMADGNGDRLQPYDIPGFFFSDGPFDTDLWTAENNCGSADGLIPFDRISAACRFIEPNQVDEILFSADGTQFIFYTVSVGEVSEVYELY
jgi:hypothetical protein